MNDYYGYSVSSSFVSPDWDRIEDLVGRKLFYVTAQYALPDGLASDLASAGAELYHGGFLEGQNQTNANHVRRESQRIAELEESNESLRRTLASARDERVRWETMYVTQHMNLHTDEYKKVYEANKFDKIALIKDVRNTLACGLKAAKNATEAWIDTHYPPKLADWELELLDAQNNHQQD